MNRKRSWAQAAQYAGGQIRKNWGLYLLLLPAFILLICFSYKPMYGVLIAFKDYHNSLGIVGSAWADPWYKYFVKFFNSYQFWPTIKNTLILSLYGMAASFPLPIILALVINQMRAKRFRKLFQTVSYLPHFISTVVMVGLILIWLSPSTGLFSNICRGVGVQQVPNLMGTESAFSSLYVWSDVWQHTGWDSIIYVAALSAVDPSLYEAATVDGANRWQKMCYIDFPMLLPTAVILLIMRVGSIMSLGFEKVYLMQNNLNLGASEIISTYVYKIGIISSQYSYSAAINLFNTIINLILLVAVNQISKKLSDNSLW
ncbi:ABC transporter permease [Caproicibacterium amylolyticum]|uniref:Sugar ABC transporter permease n=1 Tax=Caproicibacterium amylolyticum TaxID=2766537 RepID=A0A7G9WIF8_9FIRM|nr:ABC transporter permease subunit [Caproicibacterium amylolyticum]QNO18470.1 sugar ABC transporter permease [Caproicibacterium amylolyticum]